MRTYLRSASYELDEAENGEIAVRMFKSGNYDLVFMDVQMPVMDGYTATRTLREWETANGVSPTPIIALTAHALPGDTQLSYEAGCTFHMSKPVKKATLLDAIDAYVDNAP